MVFVYIDYIDAWGNGAIARIQSPASWTAQEQIPGLIKIPVLHSVSVSDGRPR